ncbi:MAG: DUF1549 and DUF1553 domain-containing protein, partial [Bacteroidota bacterium]
PEKVELPKLTQKASLSPPAESSIQNGIDHFILAKLQAENLEMSPLAAKEIIARRLALDITGLPPEQAIFDAFCKEELTYEALVDKLLAQATFGEKWASWWLDLARYADSKGYEKDNGRSIWRYRDWVIKALNDDMPYDQFTVEQLAGDLLENPSEDQLIATAFHRNTMTNDEGGTEDEEFRVAAIIDRVNTTFSVWQSTTMECVQCHSHTYDPFKNEEYYGAMAFFNNTRDEDSVYDDPKLKFYEDSDKQLVANIKQWILDYGAKEELAEQFEDFLMFNEPTYHVHHAKDFTNGELADTKWLALWSNGSCHFENIYTQGHNNIFIKYRSRYDGNQFTLRKDDAAGEILAEFTLNKTAGNVIQSFPIKSLNDSIKLFIEVKNPALKAEESTCYISWFAFLPDLPGKEQAKYAEMQEGFSRLLNTNTPTVPILIENPDYMRRQTKLFERGNWLLQKEVIPPSTPQTLNAWDENWPKNRLGFSKWLVSKENPLTARTVVNRVWQQLYGYGIVASLEDMGTQCDPPFHPELLDWLALRFMNEHRWSIKALIKEIVMSGTYRQQSESSPSLHAIDPSNRLYARGP